MVNLKEINSFIKIVKKIRQRTTFNAWSFSNCLQLKAFDIFEKERYAVVYLSAVTSYG